MSTASNPGDFKAEGYVEGLGAADPSVITFTTTVAGHACSDLLARLFGFGHPPPPNQVHQFHAHEIRTPGAASHPRHFCCDDDFVGAGDCAPFLGRAWPS